MQHAAISRAEQDEWLAELMQTYGDDILRLCYVILQDRALAEDASQEVFLKAYKRLHTLRERKYAKTWLVSIAVNTCRDQLRAAWLRHTDRSVSLEDLPPAACDFTEQDDSVLREVMALSPNTARCFCCTIIRIWTPPNVRGRCASRYPDFIEG